MEKLCVPCGKTAVFAMVIICVLYSKAVFAMVMEFWVVFLMVNISKTFVFAMVNWLCSLCCIRYGNLVVFVMDGVLLKM